MPLRLDVQRTLLGRSERVKSVDLHPTEPWLLTALYTGHIFIWNHETETVVRTFEVSDVPVRCACFVVRKNWIVCGSDDMHVRVYNYNTHERVHVFEAHTDYIRCITVHPTLPYIITASDDMSIKLWDWEKNCENTIIFEGHTHYVMQVEINPKDSNTFASASLDRTVKVWGLNSTVPHFQLEGHEKGVNCVAYYVGGDRPFLVSGADDNLVKVWDYQTKTCVATLEGHTANISAVMFHPLLPIIVSGSEDGTIRIWHSSTYRLENTLNYGLERVWSLAHNYQSNKIAIGYDEGTVMIKLGQEEPVASMDRAGKVIWARNHEIEGANVRAASKGGDMVDGEKIQLAVKEMGSCEVFPQNIRHNKNGRLVCVCGDGEYTVYTALALKNKTFGTAEEFVWGDKPDVYAVREEGSKIKVFRKFKESKSAFKPGFAVKQIFGGPLLAVSSEEFIDFYDWSDLRIVRRIESVPDKVYWSESGTLCIMICKDSYYVLRYLSELVEKYFQEGIEVDEQGIDNAFEFEGEISEKVVTGHFEGDCFIYTNSAGRLNYYIGGQTMTLAHLDKPHYILGYLRRESRVYLIDKRYNIVSYELLLSVLAYQAAIVRKDYEEAESVMDEIPESKHNSLARFLESQDLKEHALMVSKDPEHRFELALQLKQLDLAKEILLQSPSNTKWKQLGDLALQEYQFDLCEECARASDDFGTLLLLFTSTGNKKGMVELAELARAKGHYNIAIPCLLLTHRVRSVLEILLSTGRLTEAVFFARTYCPSELDRIVGLWRADLTKVKPRAAESLAEPSQYPNLFPLLPLKKEAEAWLESQDLANANVPAGNYNALKDLFHQDIISAAQEGELDSLPKYSGGQQQEEPQADAEASAPATNSTEASAETTSPEPAAAETTSPEPTDEVIDDADDLDLGALELDDDPADETPVESTTAEPESTPKASGTPSAARESTPELDIDELDLDGDDDNAVGSDIDMDELNQSIQEMEEDMAEIDGLDLPDDDLTLDD